MLYDHLNNKDVPVRIEGKVKSPALTEAVNGRPAIPSILLSSLRWGYQKTSRRNKLETVRA